jgi:hypothetical protein
MNSELGRKLVTPAWTAKEFAAGLVTALAFVTTYLLPSDARAGSYTVRQCAPELAISANAFAWRSVGSPSVVSHPSSGCGEFGLGARSSSYGAAQAYPQGAYGGYYVQAPESTAFVRFSGFFGTFSTCCISDMEAYAEVSEYPDGSGARSTIVQGSLGNASWQSPSGANGPVARIWAAEDAGFSARRLAFGLACRAAAPCLQSSSGDARVRGRSFEFGLTDLSPPAVGEPAGDLLDGGWLRGTKGVQILASDQGGGLAELAASFDDGPSRRSPSSCSKAADVYVELRPCPLTRGAEWVIDTKDFADGPHTVEISATDAGDVRTAKVSNFKVDNRAPTTPETTWLEGKDAWRSSNNFSVAWSETEEFAPIVRVHYEICPADEMGTCLASSTPVAEGTSIQVDVPSPGVYQARIWREDEAGNVEPTAKSSPVMLRFDDETPGRAYLDPPHGWLGARQADYYEQRIRLAEEHVAPVSGVSGYSVSTDGSDPDGSIDVLGSAPNYSLKNLPEGATTIKARTVSGASVPSNTVASTVVRVDRTSPAASVQPGGLADGWHDQPVLVHISGADQASLSGMVPAPIAAPATDGAHVAFRLNDGILQTERGADGSVAVERDGRHSLLYYAVDGAGNPSDKKSVAFKIDQTAPTGVFRAVDGSDPQRLVVGVFDATSGVEGGWIEYRREGVEGFTRLPTRLEGDRLAARIDDAALVPGRYEFRAVVRDVAGNEAVVGRRADGSAMELGLPVRESARLQVGAEGKAKPCGKVKGLRVAKRNGPKKRKRRAKCLRPKLRAGDTSLPLPAGKRVTLVGRLTKGQDVAIAGVDVTVEGQLRSGGPFVRLGAARPDGQGRLRFVLASGPSRTVRFRYEGSNTVRPVSAQVVTRVRAAVRLTVNRRRLVNGRSVQFKGRLPGKPIPAGGKLVALQARVGREWRTFATPRANARGAFRHRYRFTATTGIRRYAFRALVTREAAYPYETGTSRKVHVTVRGR